MSILRIPILFVGSKSEKHLNTRFDSGADLSRVIINPRLGRMQLV